MTLISCPECKKEISDKSEHCIECGAPQDVILSAVKETREESKEISDITTKVSSIVLKSAVSTLFYILILILKMFVVFGISIGITGNIGPSNYMVICCFIAFITTFLIVRKIYFSKFINSLLEKSFIKNYFGLISVLISFILWFIIIHLSFISAFDRIKNGHTDIEGFFIFLYFFVAFISANNKSFAIALVLSIIGKFGFKQNFNHLFGLQILIFTIINLIYLHFRFI
ncbi:hypothetical protein OAX32_03020 [Flavobacteriales bacterium]|nr:hypothetical protein [Flavobacteriales bacterium]